MKSPNGQAQHVAHDIVVRQIPFSFDDGASPVWNPAMPEWSHMVNGASLTMPYLEPFLVKTMREAMDQITDTALQQDVRGFVAQEAQHYQNHRRYNEMLKRNGYPELAEIEREMEADYKRLQSKSLKWRVAYTAGFETMTMGITEWLINDRRNLFTGADRSVASLVLWHMVEETEHKTVAFDVYQALYGDYRARAIGLAYGMWHVAKFSRRGYVRMLKKDGRWRDVASRLRLLAMSCRFLWNVSPMLLRSLWHGYHPSRVKDPDWVKAWTDAYRALPEGQVPLLDTSDGDMLAQRLSAG